MTEVTEYLAITFGTVTEEVMASSKLLSAVDDKSSCLAPLLSTGSAVSSNRQFPRLERLSSIRPGGVPLSDEDLTIHGLSFARTGVQVGLERAILPPRDLPTDSVSPS
jgi:hypothetical protein